MHETIASESADAELIAATRPLDGLGQSSGNVKLYSQGADGGSSVDNLGAERQTMREQKMSARGVDAHCWG